MDRYPWPAPFSSDRCQYLQSGVLKDYTDLTEDELKAEVQARNLTLYDLRRPRNNIHYAKALQASDQHDLEKYRNWERRSELPLNPTRREVVARKDDIFSIMEGRQGQIFASTYKADPDKISFLYLPGELRNYIYEYALFGDEISSQNQERHLSSRFSNQVFMRRGPWNLTEFHCSMSIHTLLVLSAMSKQIRSEARALFWAKFRFRLCAQPGWQMEVLQHFLAILGPEGRASIPSLVFKLRLTDLCLPRGFDSVPDLLPTLATCTRLQSLNLQLMVSSFFRDEIDSLEGYFLEGDTFASRDLDLFINTLAKLPNLKSIDLDFIPCYDFGTEFVRVDDFLRFVFSGSREAKLWTEVKERLQASVLRDKNQTIHMPEIDSDDSSVLQSHDEMMDYEAWLKATRRGRHRRSGWRWVDMEM